MSQEMAVLPATTMTDCCVTEESEATAALPPESPSVDLHVDDTYTERLPCRTSERMHESDEGPPSNSSSSELTDEVVQTLNNHRRGKRKKKNIIHGKEAYEAESTGKGNKGNGCG